MGYHKYHEDWIRKHFDDYRYIHDLHRDYCERFSANISFRAMCHWCERRGLKSHRYAPWSDDEIAYFKEVYPTHSNVDTQNMLNERFGNSRTLSAIRTLAVDLGIKQEDGVKGQTLRQMFKADNGTVRVYNGYSYIRLEEDWYPYGRYLLEQNLGELPKGYQVIFKDGDKANLAIENLIGIPTRWMSTIIKFDWRNELLEIGLLWFRLRDLCNGIDSRIIRKE